MMIMRMMIHSLYERNGDRGHEEVRAGLWSTVFSRRVPNIKYREREHGVAVRTCRSEDCVGN